MRLLAAFLVLFFGLGDIALAQAPFAGKAEPSSAQLQNGCDNGNATDCGDLAHRYDIGKSMPKNEKTAAALFQRACDGGDAYGCMRLAIAYNDGSGVKADDARAAKFSERACNGGSGVGCALLGTVYSKGGGGYPKDLARAQELFGQACFSTDDFESPANLAARLACPALAKLTGKPACASFGGLGGGGGGYKYCYEHERAWKQTIIPAPTRQVDPTVTASTAITAGNGAYARKDYASALAQFAAACDAGNASACAAVGNMYVQGEGVTRNGARAAAPLAMACDAGLAASCGKLGVLYDNGDGVRTNKARAFGLFNTACSGSDMLSCYNMGRLYERGDGTTPNVSLAASLYQKACTAGIADGCSSIGTMYVNGVHFEKSDVQAVAYFNLACSQGRANSCQQSKEIKFAMNRQAELRTARLAASLPARTTYSPNCAKANTFADDNLTEAERYARMGIQLNDPYCIHMMGWVSENRGDYELAFAYYSNAAKKGMPASMHNIGGLFSNGQYVERNRAVGTEWYKRALKIAESDNNTGLIALARRNILANEEAMRPAPRREKVCRTFATGVTTNPDGSGGPLIVTECN